MCTLPDFDCEGTKIQMGYCLKPLVCGFISLVIDGDTPACEFYEAKDEGSDKIPAKTCSNCKFWSDASGP